MSGTQSSDAAVRAMQYDAQKKSAGVAYLLWFFLGMMGGHRFYLGRTGSAVAMLVIFGLSVLLSVVLVGFFGFFIVGIWTLVDAFLIPGMVRDHNLALANTLR